MDIQKTINERGALLRLTGRLDAFWAEHLDEELEKTARDGQRHISLDMSGLDYISSAGLRVLVKTSRTLKAAEGAFGVIHPSPNVAAVLKMTGLDTLVMARDADASAMGLIASFAPGETFYENADGSFVAEIVGHFDMGDEIFTVKAKAHPWQAGKDRFALGVGALGAENDDCRDRYGDFLSVAGTTAYLPTDGPGVPDFLHGSDTFNPVARCLNRVSCVGAFANGFFFERGADREDLGLPLSALAADALARVNADRAGIVLLGETDGLVCASLKRSPALLKPGEDFFAFPGVRDWIAFTHEKQCPGQLAVVFGVVCRDREGALAKICRPIGEKAPDLSGRFTAAAISFRLLKRGPLDLRETMNDLFSEEKLLDVSRLIYDDRPIVGAGESGFVRGCCWVAPIRDVNAEGMTV